MKLPPIVKLDNQTMLMMRRTLRLFTRILSTVCLVYAGIAGLLTSLDAIKLAKEFPAGSPGSQVNLVAPAFFIVVIVIAWPWAFICTWNDIYYFNRPSR